MGCLLAIVSVMMPRFVLLVIAITTDLISQAFESMGWAFLGWLFMPYTTLAYMVAMLQNDHQLSGGWIVLMIVAVLFDLGGQGSTVSSRSSE
jgi:hypothetical protein